MVGGSTSSSTSNTLSFAPGMAASLPRQNGVSDVSALLESLAPASRHAFLQPPPSIPNASLQILKDTLDGFAGQISDEQLQELKQSNKDKKRKREEAAAPTDVLKIRKVHLDGFETGQVWQQARRIIQSTLGHSEKVLQELVEREEVLIDDDEEDEEGITGLDEDEDEEDEEEELNTSDLEALAAEEDGESLLDGAEEDHEDDGLEGEEGEEEEEDSDPDAWMNGVEDDGEEDDDAEGGSDDGSNELVEDPHGLNDGFFSIDEFNKQSQWFEDQDARGDPNTDAASDEEEIDWNADPMAQDSESKAKKKTAQEEDDDDEEDDGPTFGDMDLNAPEGESEDEDEEMGEDDAEQPENNANDIFYKDFFAPPRKKRTSDDRKPRKSKSAARPVEDAEVERAMRDVRRDLFEDESDHGEDSEGDLSDVSAGDPRSRRSAHERRQAKLSEEIRKLEAAAVAKREWMLSGETTGVERPVNSLLEEDLDFEHQGKPVPVITQEVTDSIEDLIKRRIIAQEFDEVLRRRPDADSVAAGTRRGLFEIDDAKSGKGLAEVYEDEYQKDANPEGYVSKADEKLRKEEAEVARMWKELSATLDALSSWNYRPRPTEAALNVVADTPTIAMEDAQPATAQGVAGGESTLAPQEVYKAGGATGKEGVEKGEVVTRKGGMPLAREEMSREEKQRRRRREKERIRKAGGADAAAAAKAGKAGKDGRKGGSRAQLQKETVADLKKGGVKVINRKGEVVDMAGNKAKPEAKVSSSNFKL